MATPEQATQMMQAMTTMMAQIQTIQAQVAHGVAQVPVERNEQGYGKRWHEDLDKRLEVFDGTNFVDWKFKFRHNTLALTHQNMLEGLDEFAKETEEISLAKWEIRNNEEWKLASRSFYSIFADKLKGDPLELIKGLEDGMNGFEAWRRLNHRYDGRTIGKHVSLSCDISSLFLFRL